MNTFHPTPSPARRRVLEAVLALEKAGEPAFVPDLVRALGLAAESSLTRTLERMERDGWLDLHGGGAQGRSRVLRLTQRARQVLGLGGLPLLGTIPAGLLSEALADPDTTYFQGHDLLAWQSGDFLLRVRGDSMTGDGILDGDKVLLRPDVALQDGEIAAVLVGGEHEATLKRVYREGDKIRLKAGNPLYVDMVLDAESVRVAGVFRGLIRDNRR